MINVCAKYCGATIILAECNTEEEAKEFMKNDYVLYYADEIEDEEDEIIHPDEMFLSDEEIPFCEPMNLDEIEWDDLPF